MYIVVVKEVLNVAVSLLIGKNLLEVDVVVVYDFYHTINYFT